MIIALAVSATMLLVQASEVKVTDGDSIRAKEYRIRLYGIDAPEIKQVCYANDEPIRCGERSKQALEHLIDGKSIECHLQDKDRYGRFVAECFAKSPKGNDSVNINQQMVLSGWAVAYSRYSEKYVHDEGLARKDKKGMWQYHFKMPWHWRAKKVKGSIE